MWNESKIFKLLPFYNSHIDISKIKKLSNLQLLKELPFYDEIILSKIILHLIIMPKVI